MANAVTADQIVAVVNSLGMSIQDVTTAFASAKLGVQSKTVQSLVETALQKDGVLRAGENDELAPFQQALSDKSAEIEATRSERANAIAAAQATLAEVAAGRILTDDELKTLQTTLDF